MQHATEYGCPTANHVRMLWSQMLKLSLNHPPSWSSASRMPHPNNVTPP